MITNYSPPWWSYIMLVGFIFLGIYFLKLWKESKDPLARNYERLFAEIAYRNVGLLFLITGIMGLIIEIYQAFTGWVAT